MRTEVLSSTSSFFSGVNSKPSLSMMSRESSLESLLLRNCSFNLI